MVLLGFQPVKNDMLGEVGVIKIKYARIRAKLGYQFSIINS